MFGLVALVGLLSVVGGRDDVAVDPGLVTLSASPDRAALAAGEAASLVVRLQLEAATRPADAEIPVNLGVLLDTSGSMAGEPIEQARAAVHALVDQLGPNDRLTLVTFDSRAQLVLPQTVLDDADLDALHERIDDIRAEGTTDLAAGLGTLLHQLGANPTPGDLDRIVIVGDGVPNDAGPIPGQVERARQAGFAITTLGVGLDYDEVLLGEMARSSGGRFHHIEDGEALTETFTAELLGAQRPVATNVMLQLSTGPGVTITRVIGHSPAMSGVHQHAVVMAELAEGESQEVFVELATEPAKAGATLELLDAIVQFDDRAGGSGRIERRAFVSMPVSGDRAVLAMRAPEIEVGAAGARAAAATIEAIAYYRDGDLASADALLFANENAVEQELRRNAYEDNAPALVRQGEEITRLRGHLRATPPKDGFGGGLAAGEDLKRVAKEANSVAVDLLQAK